MFHNPITAPVATKTWEDYLEDGRQWARVLHSRSGHTAPLSRGSLEHHARAYADVNCPHRIKNAYFAAAKAARDLECSK